MNKEYRGYRIYSVTQDRKWVLNSNIKPVGKVDYKKKIRLKEAFERYYTLIDEYIVEAYKNKYHMNDKTGQVFITNTIEEYNQVDDHTWEIFEKSNFLRIKRKLSQGASVSEALKYPIGKELKIELLNIIRGFQFSFKNKHINNTDEQRHYLHDQDLRIEESKKDVGEWGMVGGNFNWYFDYECSDYIIYLSPEEYTG